MGNMLYLVATLVVTLTAIITSVYGIVTFVKSNGDLRARDNGIAISLFSMFLWVTTIIMIVIGFYKGEI